MVKISHIDDDSKMDFTPDITDEPVPMISPHKLAIEVWLLVFRKLHRNDLDSCELVCYKWFDLLRAHKKFLAHRRIDYMVISSKRIFSMILASEDHIKVYRCEKYFNSTTLHKNINDQSLMTVESIRRLGPKPKIDCVAKIVEDIRANVTSKEYIGGRRYAYVSNRYKEGRDSLEFRIPLDEVKTRFKICTPPRMFFQKLNYLLWNLDHVKHLVLADLTLTNSFVTQFIRYIDFAYIDIQQMSTMAIKRTEINDNLHAFLFNVIFTEKKHAENQRRKRTLTPIN